MPGDSLVFQGVFEKTGAHNVVFCVVSGCKIVVKMRLETATDSAPKNMPLF
jgi:hypothetical protein